MDENKLPPEILERFRELPETVQRIIVESGWEDTIRQIIQKYNLKIDQGALVETEVMLIMFGFINPDDFTQDLIKDANIAPEIANQIENEVSEQIFKQIRDKMQVVTEEPQPAPAQSSEPQPTAVNPQPNNPQPVENAPQPQQLNNPTIESETKNADTAPNTNPIVSERLSHEEVEKPKKVDPYLEPIE